MWSSGDHATLRRCGWLGSSDSARTGWVCGWCFCRVARAVGGTTTAGSTFWREARRRWHFGVL
eukprot:3900878-Lingulodinium_polyedra.AAC.1